MRILFLTDNFPPEVNAPATRTFEHCCEWQKAGHDVTVITCCPNFPKGKVFDGYKNRLYQREYTEGLKIIRVWTYIAENKGFFKRVLDYISFSVSGFIAGLFQTFDIVVATSPQFFTALCGRALAFWKRRPWIMEVRDIWPESIKTVGVMSDNLFIRYFEWQEKKCYKSAKKIVVVTDAFKENLKSKGVPASKIYVVKNGVNLDFFKARKKNSELAERLGVAGKKVLGYIGTHGMAHKLDFLIDSVKELADKNYVLLLIGDGAEKRKLQEKVTREHIKNVIMLDSVSKEAVPEYIALQDAALINLKRDDLFKTVIPSKIFETAAMGIPILIGVDGEARSIIETYGVGLYYEPENKSCFIHQLEYLFSSQEFYQQCRDNCQNLVADFDRKKLAYNMLKVIESVVSCK